ncbi:MAG TPA: diaminopimelate decarboxylase [Candidatus Acidoferrales bacterium]|nr:diaminopimelate decarboxylase [Candidatus Acidoferrales bacterium]
MTRPPNSPRGRRARGGADPTQYTPCFAYHSARGGPGQQALYCEDVALSRVADAVGTPAYVYSRASIEAAYRRLDRAFGSLPHAVCYAMKANSNLSVLRVLARLGSCFDIVSGGELDRLRRVGVSGHRIVFSGVGKTREEIREALRYPGKRQRRSGILMFNAESGAELEVLLGEAARHVKAGCARPSIAIRVNPDVLAGGHPHIATGAHHHKFGVDWPEARRLYLAHADSRWIAWRGITAHLGSQIFSMNPYRQALARLASYVRELARSGIRLDHIDIGGGLGIRYTNEEALAPADYAHVLAEIVRPLRCRLLIEPGRTLVGSAGVLLTRVLYLKANRGKTFVVVDAAMNDLIRPVLYSATHPITPALRESASRLKRITVDVVGPVCESGDFLARDWPLAPVKAGDLLVVWTAGAYGFVQSSNYNARRRAAEVLVEGRRFRVARRRENYADLVRGEPL